MQGRDVLFGSILEGVLSNIEEAEAKEENISDMVGFYAKMIEGNTPYASILKLAEEHKMTPEEVFALLKEGGHTDVASLSVLEEADASEGTKVDEKGEVKQLDAMGATVKKSEQQSVGGKDLDGSGKIGEPSAPKVPVDKPKGGADHSDVKQLDAMGATIKKSDQQQSMGGKALDGKGKIGEPKATSVPVMKIKDGKVPNDKDLETVKMKKLTEADQLAKDVAELAKSAKAALDAGEYDEAQDLVSRLAQVQMVLPNNVEEEEVVEELPEELPEEEEELEEMPEEELEDEAYDMPPNESKVFEADKVDSINKKIAKAKAKITALRSDIVDFNKEKIQVKKDKK